MTSRLFDDMLLQGIRSGQMPARTQASREWYRAQALKAVGVSGEKLIREMAHDKSRTKMPVQYQIGSMYTFLYSAKHKDTLPYWDACPLIFPIDVAKGGIYSLNFHYLPLQLRAKLMDALYDISNNQYYDLTTKLKISYGTLKSAAKYDAFKPAFKHHLFSQIRSKLIYIHPSEWDICLFLPTASFQKASQSKVWADSKRMLRPKKRQ